MRASTIRTDRDYASWLVGAILFVVVGGFGRSFYLLPLFGAKPEWAAKEPLFYVHGLVFSAWFVLLAMQTWFIRAGSLRLHRKFGYAGAGLGALVFLVGSYVALSAANRPTGFMGIALPPQQFLITPLLDIALFGTFLALAVSARNRAARHKRLIILASISLLDAPIARVEAMVPSMPDSTSALVYAAFIAVMVVWDIDTERRIRTETVLGGATLIGLTLLSQPFATLSVWQAPARRMMSMVGPP